MSRLSTVRCATSIMAPSGTVLEKQLVIWAAGVAAAAALGYVVLGSYLPSFTWNKKMDETVPGLYNRYGNDCFANCVIQVRPPLLGLIFRVWLGYRPFEST